MGLSDIFPAIEPIAQQYGVPENIWESVAQMESSYNPSAVGDLGTSFGVFQIHIGGQANNALNAGYTKQDLLNPKVNATFAMPYIADAWNKLKNTFDDSLSWWTQFASISGHPGGVNPIGVAAVLKSDYDARGGGSTSIVATDGTTQIANNIPTNVSTTSDTTSTSSIPQSFLQYGLIFLFVVISLVLIGIAITILH